MHRRWLVFLAVLALFVSTIATVVLTEYPVRAASEAKTLKVGFIRGLGTPLGRDSQRLMEAVVAAVNAKGGLTVGGESYRIQLIIYDSKDNAETARAAAERLVFQDGVKFVLGDTTADAWIAVTEANKVVTIVGTPSPAVLAPRFKYIFQSSFLNTAALTNWAWFAGHVPSAKKLGLLFADNLSGHGDERQMTILAKALGFDIGKPVYYPAGTTDFSAIATRIRSTEPDVFTTAGGGPLEQVLALKAMRQLGWKGPYFGYRPLNPGLWIQLAPLDSLEGSYFAVSDIDMAVAMKTPMSPVCKEAYDAYVAKYGKWDFPTTDFTVPWYVLKAALLRAQTTDPEKVAAAIAGGLKFEAPFGPGLTIARPDMNNPARAVDAVFGTNMATVQNGKLKVVQAVSAEEAFDFVKRAKVFGVYP
jgi:ABC-type branched-subunit amino acid transport system substrate-binding protein